MAAPTITYDQANTQWRVSVPIVDLVLLTGVPTLFGLWSRPLACITTPKAID